MDNKSNYKYLLSDLTSLKGVGIKTANLLKRKKINNIFDLLWKLPKSYTDRSVSSKIKDLKIGENQTITISPQKYSFPRIRNLPNKVLCSDDTGEIDLIFFNSFEGYVRKILPIGKEITVSGGQEAARNYPKSEDPGDMFAQKEVEELLPQSFASRNQELKARLQAHANWVKQDRFNNTFVHVQSNTVRDGNNTYRVAMSQHYNGNYEGFKNPKFTEIRVKELDDEMENDLGYYIVDTTALMGDLKNLKTISRQS